MSEIPKSINFLGRKKSGKEVKCVLVVSQTVFRSRSQTLRGKLSLFYDEMEHFGKTDKIYIVLFNFDTKTS